MLASEAQRDVVAAIEIPPIVETGTFARIASDR